MTWQCDCDNVKNRRYTKLRLTTVDKDEICIKCGYYAVKISDYEIFPRGKSIGGYRPIANYQTLTKTIGLNAELVHAIKDIPGWIDTATGKMKKGSKGIDRSKA